MIDKSKVSKRKRAKRSADWKHDANCWKRDAEQLRKFLMKAKTTQKQFAELLGVDERTVRRYVSATHPVPPYVFLAARAVEGAR